MEVLLGGRQVVALEVAFWRVHSRAPQLAGAPCHFPVAMGSSPHYGMLARGAQAVPFTQIPVFPCSSSYLGVRFSQLECHFTVKNKIK